jgi:probable rRNA maturation factor
MTAMKVANMTMVETMADAIHVDIDNACDAQDVPDNASFLHWISCTLQGERQRADVAVRIVDEEESAALNAHYRQKNTATNVLSFSSELPEEYEPPILGDLAICADVVRREAQQQHKTVTAHWAHMVIHGTLHLLGFDHIDETDAAIMEAREIAILASLGFPDPYIEELASHVR